MLHPGHGLSWYCSAAMDGPPPYSSNAIKYNTLQCNNRQTYRHHQVRFTCARGDNKRSQLNSISSMYILHRFQFSSPTRLCLPFSSSMFTPRRGVSPWFLCFLQKSQVPLPLPNSNQCLPGSHVVCSHPPTSELRCLCGRAALVGRKKLHTYLTGKTT